MGERENRIELAENYLSKAKQKIESAEILSNAGKTEDSISRSYYAVYLSAQAALYLIGEDSKTHGGCLKLFGLKFVKTGDVEKKYAKIFADLLNLRQQSDYSPFSWYDLEDALEQLKNSKEFVNRIEDLVNSLKTSM